jgi:hypothetical protein
LGSSGLKDAANSAQKLNYSIEQSGNSTLKQLNYTTQ